MIDFMDEVGGTALGCFAMIAYFAVWVVLAVFLVLNPALILVFVAVSIVMHYLRR